MHICICIYVYAYMYMYLYYTYSIYTHRILYTCTNLDVIFTQPTARSPSPVLPWWRPEMKDVGYDMVITSGSWSLHWEKTQHI